MAKYLMIQGATSNAGKTTICAGLCRILSDVGYKVVPFKAQNMGLNSFFDSNGLEMGYGQAIQAYASQIEPQAIMNPLLLKPKGESKIDIILNGKYIETLTGAQFYKKKQYYFEKVMESFKVLESKYDIIIIEGAGSPAEINVNKPDIANMGIALKIKAPVLLVGNIELGGVFASLYGTYALLEEKERELIKGFIINKLYGNAQILNSGIEQLESLMNINSIGVVPHLELDLEDEDMVSNKMSSKDAIIKIGIIKTWYSTNLNVFRELENFTNISIYYIENLSKIDSYDILILPSSNNVILDIKWYKENIKFKNQLLFGYQNAVEIYNSLEIDNQFINIDDRSFKNLEKKIVKPIVEYSGFKSSDFINDRDMDAYRESEIVKLATHLKNNINLDLIYELLEI